MDIALLINIFFIVTFYFLKRTKENYIPFYSFSLFVFTLTCVYLFYKYGMRETPSTMTRIYFYSSPFLLVFDIILIYRQSRSSKGIGITNFLKNVLSAQTKTSVDKIFPAVILYLVVTGTIYSVVYFYEYSHPTSIPGDPNRWSLSLFHFVWQYLYILPLTLMFWYMNLKKFTKTLIICSILYPIAQLLWIASCIWLH